MRFKHLPLFLIASFLFGLKTYIVYRFMFSIELGNLLQEIIIFLNPFITSFVFFGLVVFIKQRKRQLLFISYATLIGTLIIYFNLVFYRSFTDFLTLPQLFQTSNMADLGTSILSLIKLYDIFLFLDVFIIWYLSKKALQTDYQPYTRKFKSGFIVIAISLLAFNVLLSEIERPQLFSRGFDRQYLVKNIGLFYYHVYDAVVQTKMKTERVFADENEIKDIVNYINEDVRSKKVSPLFGEARDKNVIFISAESIQSFVINNSLHDEEITPFLNRLVKDKDTYYFENFYHQTAQGKTSDSEFLIENSLYPTSRGAVFFTHANNKYHSFANMLEEKDYHAAVFHANNDSFWNRNQIYEQLKIDHYYDKEYYDVNDENSIGWGLKDKSFFDQSMTYLKDLPTPFYAKLITLTNHFPFELEDDDRTLAPFDSNSTTLNNYFSTVRYTDEALEQFFMQLKAAGLYEDSIIVIMGDHDGISANHNKAMSYYLDKEEITPYDYIQLQRVPFFIHIPGHEEGKVMSTIAGQIDVKPTLLHLLGIETKDDIYFGNDLFHDDRKDFIALRNGDYVSEDYVYTNDLCFDRNSGDLIWSAADKIEESETSCLSIKEDVEKELHYSDAIIYGDLFRFINFK